MVTLQDRVWPVPVSGCGLSSDRFVTAGGLRGIRYRRAGALGIPARSAVAIGQFDGVHRGHQALLSRTRREAPPEAAVGAVTFDRHPMTLLAPDRVPPMLSSLEDKVRLLMSCRLDFVVVMTLEPALLATGPVAFVDDLLVSTLNAATVAVGPNFRFGRAAAGDPTLLQQLGPASGFAVVVPGLTTYGEAAVSATAIRAAIAGGDVDVAARLLGRPYQLCGFAVEVTRGLSRISVPANVAAPASGQFVGLLRVSRDDDHDRFVETGVHVDVRGSRLEFRTRKDGPVAVSSGDQVSLALTRRLDPGAHPAIEMENR